MKKPLEDWLGKSNFFSFKTHDIFYNQFGKGDDIVIIHGYPYNSYEWKEIVPLLSKNYKVTVFDLLGFGFSDKPDNHTYSFQEYTDLLNNLVLHLKIEQAHIIAHDLGVSIAQELVASENDENLNFSIKSICFTNGNLFPDVYKPRLIQKLLSQTPIFFGKFLSKTISKKIVHKNIRNLFGKYTQPSEEYMEELWGILNFKKGKNISYLLGRLVFEKIKHQERWTSAMKKTTIPLAYICGPADPNSGIEMGIAFEKRIPNGKLIWMDDEIGHWPMIEDKVAFLKNYFQWLSTIEK